MTTTTQQKLIQYGPWILSFLNLENNKWQKKNRYLVIFLVVSFLQPTIMTSRSTNKCKDNVWTFSQHLTDSYLFKTSYKAYTPKLMTHGTLQNFIRHFNWEHCKISSGIVNLTTSDRLSPAIQSNISLGTWWAEQVKGRGFGRAWRYNQQGNVL